jgi:hypothetical protein
MMAPMIDQPFMVLIANDPFTFEAINLLQVVRMKVDDGNLSLFMADGTKYDFTEPRTMTRVLKLICNHGILPDGRSAAPALGKVFDRLKR